MSLVVRLKLGPQVKEILVSSRFYETKVEGRAMMQTRRPQSLQGLKEIATFIAVFVFRGSQTVSRTFTAASAVMEILTYVWIANPTELFALIKLINWRSGHLEVAIWWRFLVSSPAISSKTKKSSAYDGGFYGIHMNNRAQKRNNWAELNMRIIQPRPSFSLRASPRPHLKPSSRPTKKH